MRRPCNDGADYLSNRFDAGNNVVTNAIAANCLREEKRLLVVREIFNRAEQRIAVDDGEQQ